MARTISIALLLGVVFSLIQGCNGSMTDHAFGIVDVLQDAIEAFEASRTEADRKISSTSSSTLEKMQQPDPDVRLIASDWEREWDAVKDQIGDLEQDLGRVERVAQAYFEELDALAQGIMNPGTKREELRKNRELWTSWHDAYRAALRDIEQIRQLLQEGDDFHRVLLAARLRMQVEGNRLELEDLSLRAQEIMKNLQALTREGRQLVHVQ